MNIPQAMTEAVRLQARRQFTQAESLYRTILAAAPYHADALLRLGILCGQTGRLDAAIDLLKQLISQQPQSPEAHYNLGIALTGKQRLDEATAAFQQAIALKPDYAEAWNNLGYVQNLRSDRQAATAAYQKAIALRPDQPQAYVNLGNVLRDISRFDESIAAYRAAISLKSDSAEAHNNLGVVLKQMGRLSEALESSRAAARLRPESGEFASNMGVALEAIGESDEALKCFQLAIQLQPDHAQAYYNLGNIEKAFGHLSPALAAYRRAIEINPAFIEAHNNLIYTLHFDEASDASMIATEQQRWNQQYAEPLKLTCRPHTNNLNPDRRLRIGYVSPDFHQHPVGRFVAPLFSHHDKSNFELFAYASVSNPDDLTHRLKSCTDHWRDVREMNDAQLADLIRTDEIDILVDLTMHMAGSRLRAFARKPAPVQVSWLAYGGSTGLPAIGYRLSDPYLDIPGETDNFYSEKTVVLRHTYWCYEPTDPGIDLQPPPSIARGYVTFGCLNQLCKMSPSAFSTWMKLLRHVPSAKLLLYVNSEGVRQELRDRLSTGGVSKDRVHFVGKLPMKDYLLLYNQVDIALDPFPYGGGTTTCDALWMGVPVISMIGKSAVGRGGVSILSNIGVTDLLARSVDEYVNIATELANDLPRLGELRRRLRTKMQNSVLMDAPAFADEIESAFRTMWHHWCGAAAHDAKA